MGEADHESTVHVTITCGIIDSHIITCVTIPSHIITCVIIQCRMIGGQTGTRILHRTTAGAGGRVDHVSVTAIHPLSHRSHHNFLDNSGGICDNTYAGGKAGLTNGVTQMPSDLIEDSETEENGGTHVFIYGLDDDPNQIRLPMSDVSAEMMWIGFTRAFRHVLSNEVASKVGTLAKKLVADGTLADSDAGSDSKWAKDKTVEFRNAFVDSVKAGTWGSGTRGPSGPRVDPLTTEYNRELAKEVKDYLAKNVKDNYLKYDKEAKVWFTVNDDGSRNERTFDIACDRYEARLSDADKSKIMARAQAVVDFKRKRAEDAKAAKMESVAPAELLI